MAASRDCSLITEYTSVATMPIATTSTVAIGDLLIYNGTSQKVEAMTAVAQSTAFVGVAGSNYPVTSLDGSIGNFVKVYKKGVFEFNVTAGTAYFQDDEFRWAGTAANTVALSTSNKIGRLWEDAASTATVIRLKIDDYVAF